MRRNPVTVSGSVVALIFAAVVGTVLVIAQALVRIVARRHRDDGRATRPP